MGAPAAYKYCPSLVGPCCCCSFPSADGGKLKVSQVIPMVVEQHELRFNKKVVGPLLETEAGKEVGNCAIPVALCIAEAQTSRQQWHTGYVPVPIVFACDPLRLVSLALHFSTQYWLQVLCLLTSYRTKR